MPKELKERIKLIRTLKEAKDEAAKIDRKIHGMHRSTETIVEAINALIDRVENLDKLVESEE